jgi:acyl dehydratase
VTASPTVHPMSTLAEWELRAHNTATLSANKIHDDEVARRFGFGGGLVPGVDVYAYLTHPPAAAWGLAWLERGTMRARFTRPVYEGDLVRVVPVEQVQDASQGPRARLELRNANGDVCATAEASLPNALAEDLDVDAWPVVDQALAPAPASPETLVPGMPFGLMRHGFHADRAGEYLDDVRETLPLYRTERVAHPGWVLRDANYVLSQNVRLGPWIHVESVTQHHRLIRDGAIVSTRAVVAAEWEHKGHRFVTLDVMVLADDAVATRVQHTAIYAPRQVQ